MPANVELIAFADDVAVTYADRTPATIKEKLDEVFRSINSWMGAHGLDLAAQKTDALVITRRRVRNSISVTCGEYTIPSKPSVRYLRV